MLFKDKVITEYPLPMSVSIWGDPAIANLDDLIQMCLEDTDSDLEVYESLIATGIITQMPDTCRVITSAVMQMPFQGNRYVHHTYDKHTKRCYLRYFPAVIYYKRGLNLDDIETLKGSRSQYLKFYVLWKMVDKEVNYLQSITLNPSEGEVNLEGLKEFRERCKQQWDTYKADIMLYSNNG